MSLVIFPKSGPVRVEIEHLPREQKPLELTIGQKFVGAMSYFEHGVLTDLQLGDEPADLRCTNADGDPVSIQVTEMVDTFGAVLNAQRDNYLRALKERCTDTLAMFSGCRLDILDEGTEDFIPPLNGPEGEATVKELATHFETMALEIDTLGVKKVRSRKWTIGTSGKTVMALCKRYAEAAPEVDYAILWGRQRTFRADEMNALLPDTIKNKIDRSYAQPDHEFWLLIYSTEMPLPADDDGIELAATLLDGISHPFNKVWFFYPYHDRDLGHVVPVWPRP